jgi:hypothetical protein
VLAKLPVLLSSELDVSGDVAVASAVDMPIDACDSGDEGPFAALLLPFDFFAMTATDECYSLDLMQVRGWLFSILHACHLESPLKDDRACRHLVFIPFPSHLHKTQCHYRRSIDSSTRGPSVKRPS